MGEVFEQLLPYIEKFGAVFVFLLTAMTAIGPIVSRFVDELKMAGKIDPQRAPLYVNLFTGLFIVALFVFGPQGIQMIADIADAIMVVASHIAAMAAGVALAIGTHKLSLKAGYSFDPKVLSMGPLG